MDELMEKNKKLPNGKIKSVNKDTRWERIRNRHMNSLNVRTETVKKFFELDFIDTKQMKILNGDIDENSKINPALVMDLRHEMIERVDKRKRAIAIEREMAMERLKRHNQLVENHYIENELKKFKADMEKTRVEASKRLQKPKICLDLTNKTLYENLENCNNTIGDFYSAPIDAIKEVSRIYEESKQKFNSTSNEAENKLNENVNVEMEEKSEIIESLAVNVVGPLEKNHSKINEKKDNLNSKEKNQIKIIEKKDSAIKIKKNQKEELRCVRFDNSIEVISYCAMESECDNDSERMDSEISDLADQVLHIIEGEINMEMVGKNVEIVQLHGINNSKIANVHEITEDTGQIVEVHRTINRSELNEKDLVLKVNDDLLRITKLEPQSNDIKVIVEVQPPSDDESEKSNSDISNEHNAIIAELFRPKFPQKEILMRHYFLKWIHYVTIEKFERENCSHKTSRLSKINAFLDTLRKEKRKVLKQNDETERPFENQNNSQSREKSIVLTKKYRNKIKVQQDIIELQKLKLERQERMIMELKLKKISEDTALSRQELKNELKTMIKTGETKSRLKAKSLQLVGNLRDEEDEEHDRLQVKSLMMPKFLQKMQERALERSVKHEQARQRRLQNDAEKEAAKMAAEEAKRQEDEEAKRRRIEALQEKRRQEKMAKFIKERERQRALANAKKSQDFCHRLRLKFGMNAFKLLICLKRKNYRRAEKLRKKLLTKDHFNSWHKHYVEIWENKTSSADNMYIKNLKLKIFHNWIIYTADEKSKYLVAVDWYELKISEFIFKHWLGYTKLQKMIEETKTFQAESHFQWHLKWSVLEKWQRLPQILKLERETEARRQRWRLKIWELLPDYTPNQRFEDD